MNSPRHLAPRRIVSARAAAWPAAAHRAARTLLLVLAVFPLSLSVPGQTPPPQAVNPNETVPKGSITGRVVGEDGQPISNVTIMAFTQGGGGSSSGGGSDAKGKFTLSNLAPGAYTLNAFAPGYVLDTDFTADPAVRNYYRLGDSVTVRMVKGGVITGTVTDTNGIPLVGARVNIMRVREPDGRPVRDTRAFGFSPQRLTDDRGVYRIYGLSPGAYVVMAGGKGKFSFDGQTTAFDADAPTYYPSTTRDTAVEVSVQAGQEMTGIDIRHRREPGRIVSGTVSATLSSGQPVNGTISISVKHVSASTTEGFAFIRPGEGDRGFSFEGLSDGDYDIIALGLSPSEGNAATPPRRVSIRGADVTGIKLTLAPLGSIAGRVVFEPAKPAPGKNACQPARATRPEETVVFTRRDEPVGAASQVTPFFAANNDTTADSKGEFNVRSLEAGRYRPAVRLFNEDFYVRAMSFPAPATKPAPGGAATPSVDPARVGLTLRAGERLTGLVVNIAGGAASLSGRIVAAAATTEGAALTDQPLQRVYLIPAEREQADNVLRYAEAAPLADGSFSLDHLAPGRYFIIARAADKEGANLTPRPLAWDAAARAALRREAESANVAIDLSPCQRAADFVLRSAAK